MPIFPTSGLAEPTQLDAPPPSPQAGGGMPGVTGLAAPLRPGSAMPPEILTGALAVGEKINDQIDALSQVAPDIAPDLQMLKEQLQMILAKLLIAGGQSTAPSNPGPNFTGGTMDRGQAGPPGTTGF